MIQNNVHGLHVNTWIEEWRKGMNNYSSPSSQSETIPATLRNCLIDPVKVSSMLAGNSNNPR